MIDQKHRKAVYDELSSHIDRVSGVCNLYMNVFVARQLFSDEPDPNFSIRGNDMFFKGILILPASNNNITLTTTTGGLLYSIVWDPDPDKKAHQTKMDVKPGTVLSGAQAMRFNEGKLDWSLIDFKCLEGMVRVMDFGQKKYERENWKRGLPMQAQCASMMRHLVAIMSGEVKDPETGEYHWSHIACNAMFMDHTYKNHPQHIDLPTPGHKGSGVITHVTCPECKKTIEVWPPASGLPNCPHCGGKIGNW